MKAIFRWLSLLGLGQLWFPLHAADQPLRVVTWNLQWFPGKSPGAGKEAAESHVAEVQGALVTLNPDILVLQEVAAQDPVLKAISVLPGFRVSVISRFKNGAGFVDGQQIAICSRFPALYVNSAQWKKGWADAPRGFAFAALDCGGENVIGVYGIHLKSNLGDAQANTAKREDAMAQLLTHRKESIREEAAGVKRWLICGDFNTDSVNREVPSEQTFRLLSDAGFFWTFEDVPFRRRITCPAKGRYPDACFDHVFAAGFGRPVASPVADIAGSDHLPVTAELSLGR